MDELPPKKKTSGLTIVLVILGGGALVAFLGIGIAIYAVLSSERGRAIVGVVGDGVKISAKAQKAPGTKELRAMGCKTAFVMETADLERLGDPFRDASAPRWKSEIGEMVICDIGSGEALTCDRVAATYVGAVGPRAEKFSATVQRNGSTKNARICSNVYDGQANLVRNAPRIPSDSE